MQFLFRIGSGMLKMTAVVSASWLMKMPVKVALILEILVQLVFHYIWICDLLLVFGECKHCFHQHCVDKWINGAERQQAICPLCRGVWVPTSDVNSRK